QHEDTTQRSSGGATSDPRFLAVVQGTCDLFWILTPTGDMQECSSSWQSFTGQPESSSQGSGWRDAVFPADQPQLETMLHQVVLSDQPAESACHIRRRDVVYRMIRLRAFPVCTLHGTLCELVVCGTDITSEQMSAAQIQLAVKASGVGMWHHDLVTHHFVATNQYKELCGIASDAPLTYEHLLALIHPDDRALIQELRARALAEKKDYHVEYRVIWPDGSLHWLMSRARYLYDIHNQPNYLIGATINITELKQAEEALRESHVRFRHLVDSNLIGITVADQKGTIHEANDTFLSLVGYSREDLAAGLLNWKTMTPPEYQAHAAQESEDLRTAGLFQPYEKAYVTKTGELVPALVGGTVFRRAGSASLNIAFVLDLTARKELERQRDLFLGMTGHELKTPLAALRGTLQLVQRRLKQVVPTADHVSPEIDTFFESLPKNLENSLRQVDAQTRLINDLLDLSRITANTLKMELERSDLITTIRETVEDMRVIVPERVLLLDVPKHTVVHVLADRDRIGEVVMNYITNAIRYASPDQPIQIGLTVEQDQARVWVRDRGPGLSEEAQKDIWLRYHQVKGAPVQSGSRKGLGLGLYICRTVITQHHGACGVESTPGEGATFWFTLPIVP
ncbi:MAG TPA: PAS domain-containing protein, partial [Ktedonobacteraceae bacterium]|nr:PAS domain-containing protein [Ktedonobacteraceae bacterium]